MIGATTLFRSTIKMFTKYFACASATTIAIVILLMPMEGNAGRLKKTANLNERVVLKEHVSIKNNVIRIGDLFTNAGDKAQVPIAYSPAPGQRLVLDVNWLFRAASAYKLKWKPYSHSQQSIVIRDSITYKHETIKKYIREALLKHGISQSDEVELGDRLYKIHAPNEFDSKLNVEEIAFEKKSGRFTATLSVISGMPGEVRKIVGGWVRKMTTLPVLTRRFHTNEVIRKRDIKLIPVRTSRLSNEVITNIDELIGKSSSRRLSANVPLRPTDVRPPLLVTKGSLVTMIMQSKFMRLTARGRSLENGGKGDVIKIRNLKSKKNIEAIIVGPGRVTIDPHGHFAMK
jgi:flagella basal body P-ring formation protein FlgA